MDRPPALQLPGPFRVAVPFRSVSVVLAAWLAVVLPAQGEQDPPAPPVPVAPPAAAPAEAAVPADSAARAARAIADYEALPADAKPVQRRKALLWLGEIDDPATTAFLQRQLAAAGDTAFAATVLDAIAVVPRASLQADATQVLARTSAPLGARVAAAAAILRMGDRPLDALLAMLSADDTAVPVAQKDAVLTAIAASRNDRALRGAVPLLLDGPMPARLRVLRRLDAVHDLPPLSAARVKLVRDGDLETAAVAWRQLLDEGHERGRALTVDVLERVVGEPRPAVAAELVRGLVRVQDPDFHPALLRFGSVANDTVRRALRAAAPAAAADPALLRFLLTKGLDDPQPAVRDAAKLLLAEAPAEAVRPLVERVRADLRAGRKKALDLASGLHELLAKDPSWREELAVLAGSNELEHRLLGLSLLREIGAPDGVPAAQRGLTHKAWELRSLCYRYLARCRDVSSIPLLIARVGKEEGRLEAELQQALFVHTATRCFSRREWDAWWQRSQAGFALPHEQTVRAGGTSSGGATIAYHDIPVVSARIAFVVDRSGSMHEPIGTDRKTSRLDAAKQQLVRVVEALPATHHVNLIAYESEVQPLWNELRRLDQDNRDKLLDAARIMPLGGGTNIFDALEKAFADPEVDTIYLLTDGQPSAGRVKNVDGIVEEVRRWNRTRQIVIHCIGFGIDSALLKRLAADSGGTYKHVR
jgi:hypothetical protein